MSAVLLPSLHVDVLLRIMSCLFVNGRFAALRSFCCTCRSIGASERIQAAMQAYELQMNAAAAPSRLQQAGARLPKLKTPPRHDLTPSAIVPPSSSEFGPFSPASHALIESVLLESVECEKSGCEAATTPTTGALAASKPAARALEAPMTPTTRALEALLLDGDAQSAREAEEMDELEDEVLLDEDGRMDAYAEREDDQTTALRRSESVEWNLQQ